MDIGKRIDAFKQLGSVLKEKGESRFLDQDQDLADGIEGAVHKATNANAWFTPASVYDMLHALGESMNTADLEQWTGMYDLKKAREEKTVAIVMAGNIPAVGFHDFMSVLMSGHKVLAKLSSDDKFLIPAIAEILFGIEPAFKNYIKFEEGKIKDFDAIIATGSNNTSRYFNYYFGKYPHIIRKNRNALAVLSGAESDHELNALGQDVFMYYGLGCRNVSKLFIPEGYDFTGFFEAIESYKWVADHHKYNNNYDYNKSIYLVNGNKHFDNGFLMLKEDVSMASPVSVLHYEYYDNIDQLNRIIAFESENIQCVISADKRIIGAISPGEAQHPKLWDYADGVDTMAFLLDV